MMNKMDGMDEELYGSEDSPKESPKEEQEERGTDMMSKSSFPGGCKVGDRYTVEITGDHGDQFGVKVIDKNEQKEELDEDNYAASMEKDY